MTLRWTAYCAGIGCSAFLSEYAVAVSEDSAGVFLMVAIGRGVVGTMAIVLMTTPSAHALRTYSQSMAER